MAADLVVYVCVRQGQGMVLGMGDTGLDFDNCYFSDSAVPIPYTVAQGLSREPGSGIPFFQNATHRKVRSHRRLQIIKGVHNLTLGSVTLPIRPVSFRWLPTGLLHVVRIVLGTSVIAKIERVQVLLDVPAPYDWSYLKMTSILTIS